MKNFWTELPRPFFAQAPMEDVTDAAFRRLIARHGKPDVMFTEFTSADGLVLAPDKSQPLLRKKLVFDESERPIVAQLFSATPERMERAAVLIKNMGFDGLDINMGCPVDEVVKSGSGAALIRTPELAKELIRAARRGAPDLPISIKTRSGFKKDEVGRWVPQLLEEGIAALTIHARTREDMSAVPARWETIGEAVSIRDGLDSQTLIIGNGDVRNIPHARELAAQTGCDGIMFGRAIYGNPWLYANREEPPTPQEKIQALLEHLALFDELMSATTNYSVMKKHFKAYISGWDGAKELRIRLMETNTVSEATDILLNEGSFT
jgi:nifR3 family TIM-barrel protein